MNEILFNNHRKALNKLAKKYKWIELPAEQASGKLSFIEELNAFKLEIWTSKMTVAFHRTGGIITYLKKQSYQQIEDYFKNPYEK